MSAFAIWRGKPFALPRFTCEELATPESYVERPNGLALRISSLRLGSKSFQWPVLEGPSTKETYLDKVDDELARVVHERFHY